MCVLFGLVGKTDAGAVWLQKGMYNVFFISVSNACCAGANDEAKSDGTAPAQVTALVLTLAEVRVGTQLGD